MFYNNRSFRLANMPNVQIAVSNSANPNDFAANVYKVMMTRNDNSVANAIKTALKLPLISVSNFEAIAHNHTKNQMGIILEAGVGKFYLQSFDNGIANSEITVMSQDEAEELKKTYFFVGNVEIAEEQFALDARHIAYYADHMSKEMINFSLGYLKPQYIINNYVN